MADAGALEKLPLELRSEIYALVLVNPNGIKLENYGNGKQTYPGKRHRDHEAINEVVVSKHTRHRGYRNKALNEQNHKWEPAASVIELLSVNRKVFEEAVPILYSKNQSTFYNVNTLGRFLNIISPQMKQNLRHITISSYRWRSGFAEARRSLCALAEAKNLHTLVLSHAQLCSGKQLSVDSLVALCKPLLKSLKASYAAQTLAFSVLDVFKVTFPPDDALKARKNMEDGMVERWFFLIGDLGKTACKCRVADVERRHSELKKELRKKVAKLLELADN